MAANPHGKLTPGQVLTSIPAQAWNGFVDVATAFREGRIGNVGTITSASGLPERGVIAKVRNDTGEDLPRFSVLRLTGIGITDADNPNHFKSRPYMTGDKPNDDLLQTFCITQAPIKDGGVVDGLIAGISAVQIDVIHADDKFADAIDDDESMLRSQPWGCVPILAKDSGTGTKWAYVSIGNWQRQMFVGKTLEGIAQGTNGTIQVYRNGDDETDDEVSAKARLGALDEDRWVYVLPMQEGFEVIDAEIVC